MTRSEGEVVSAPDNPAAFPVSTIDGFTQHGMTLRDWFAGQALAGYCANHGFMAELARKGLEPDEVIAAASFEMAAAMLATRTETVK